MHFPSTLLALAASASLVSALPNFGKRAASSQCSSNSTCAFEITVGGCSTSQIVDGQVRVANSSISEISDGQTRCDLNGTSPANFTLVNGQVIDQSNRVCEISSQDQFQCSATPDTGATTTGFSVCNNLLAFNGNTSFVACLATGDIPGYNIYTASVDRSTVTDCMAIELYVPSCGTATSSSCVASTTTATVTSVSVSTSLATVTTTEVSTVTSAEVSTVTKTETTVHDSAVTAYETATVTATVTDTVADTITDKVTATATDVETATVTATVTNTVANTITDKVTVATTATVQVSVTTTATDKETVTVTATPVATTVATSIKASTTSSSAAAAVCTNITRSLGSSNFPSTMSIVNEASDVSGSSYFAYVGSGNETVFTFAAPSSTGQCSLTLEFPTEAEIVAAGGTTSYSISSSSIDVTLTKLSSSVDVDVTYATLPASSGTVYTATLMPGTNSTFATFTCPTEETSYVLATSGSETLSFFEDYNLPVMGLTLATC